MDLQEEEVAPCRFEDEAGRMRSCGTLPQHLPSPDALAVAVLAAPTRNGDALERRGGEPAARGAVGGASVPRSVAAAPRGDGGKAA